ncbi:hypothetical protein K438DRAFT_1783136 [Mycena galopus ATCC 62051]|nr:hypothetical protein K438DRAFT_1783136 [Mycena galopus ATCC 62051]
MSEGVERFRSPDRWFHHCPTPPASAPALLDRALPCAASRSSLKDSVADLVTYGVERWLMDADGEVLRKDDVVIDGDALRLLVLEVWCLRGRSRGKSLKNLRRYGNKRRRRGEKEGRGHTNEETHQGGSTYPALPLLQHGLLQDRKSRSMASPSTSVARGGKPVVNARPTPTAYLIALLIASTHAVPGTRSFGQRLLANLPSRAPRIQRRSAHKVHESLPGTRVCVPVRRGAEGVGGQEDGVCVGGWSRCVEVKRRRWGGGGAPETKDVRPSVRGGGSGSTAESSSSKSAHAELALRRGVRDDVAVGGSETIGGKRPRAAPARAAMSGTMRVQSEVEQGAGKRLSGGMEDEAAVSCIFDEASGTTRWRRAWDESEGGREGRDLVHVPLASSGKSKNGTRGIGHTRSSIGVRGECAETREGGVNGVGVQNDGVRVGEGDARTGSEVEGEAGVNMKVKSARARRRCVSEKHKRGAWCCATCRTMLSSTRAYCGVVELPAAAKEEQTQFDGARTPSRDRDAPSGFGARMRLGVAKVAAGSANANGRRRDGVIAGGGPARWGMDEQGAAQAGRSACGGIVADCRTSPNPTGQRRAVTDCRDGGQRQCMSPGRCCTAQEPVIRRIKEFITATYHACDWESQPEFHRRPNQVRIPSRTGDEMCIRIYEERMRLGWSKKAGQPRPKHQ